MITIVAGTIAEFIKLSPIIEELRRRDIRFRLVGTGQNDLTKSDLLFLVAPRGVDVWVSRQEIRQTPLGLLLWFVKALVLCFLTLRREFRGARTRPIVMVHGDTISSFLGGLTGWLAGARICHVEAGLRSFNLLRPFPEEMCRVAVTRLATLAFPPNAWAAGNLEKHKSRMEIVETGENTLLDALRLALAQPRDASLFARVPERFFIFVLHRQENLLDGEFMRRMVSLIERESERISCVLLLHKPTEVAFESAGLMQGLRKNPHVVLLERQPYISFTQLLAAAEFVLSDGGSNQEECYYLGKPTLILRKETERREGLGHNALLSDKDFDCIESFLANPEHWRKEPVTSDVMPSRQLVDALARQMEGIRNEAGL